MRITKMNLEQTRRLKLLSEQTGIKGYKLVYPVLHHGLMRIKQGELIDLKLDPVKVFDMLPTLKAGFSDFKAQSNIDISILYSNALNFGLSHLENKLYELKQNPFISIH